MAFPCMRAEAVLMLLPIMRSSARDSACIDSTASNPRGLDARALTKEAGALENSAWNTS